MSIKTALIDEAISVLKISGDRGRARANLLEGMARYPLRLWEQVAIVGTYKVLEAELPYTVKNTDNMGRYPKYWE